MVKFLLYTASKQLVMHANLLGLGVGACLVLVPGEPQRSEDLSKFLGVLGGGTLRDVVSLLSVLLQLVVNRVKEVNLAGLQLELDGWVHCKLSAKVGTNMWSKYLALVTMPGQLLLLGLMAKG